MKKIAIIATSVYSSILTSILIVAGVVFGVPFGFIALFVPVWMYFFLRIARDLPYVKIIFARSRYVVAMRISGAYSLVFCVIALLIDIAYVRQAIHLFYILPLIPMAVHFAFVFPRRLVNVRSILKHKSVSVAVSEVAEKSEDEKVREEQRRKFIKLVAGAGVGIFAASVLNPKKASAAFFGSVPGPGVIGVKDSLGSKIDPAIKSPTDGYAIANIDSSTYPAYYGFVNKDGGWYIMRENPQNTFTYATGGSSFGTNWSDRSGLTYASFDTTF